MQDEKYILSTFEMVPFFCVFSILSREIGKGQMAE
jgi:hypothetical protein